MQDWREDQRKLYTLHRQGWKKQGTQAVATSHNITINNKLNLHYLLQVYHFLQKENDKN